MNLFNNQHLGSTYGNLSLALHSRDSAMGVQFKDRGYWFLTSPGLVYLFLIKLCNNLLLCLGHIFAAAYFFQVNLCLLSRFVILSCWATLEATLISSLLYQISRFALLVANRMCAKTMTGTVAFIICRVFSLEKCNGKI